MKNLLLLLSFLCLSLGSNAQQTISGELMHDGVMRTYQVYLPAAYSEGADLPMVLNLHGFGSNVFEQVLYSGLNTVAESNDFIVITPQGLVGTTTWGATDTQWDAYFGTGTDDLGFLSKLIDVAYQDYHIDLARVYSTGMSNGGFMSYRLACELSDRIAAIASVTGAMPLAMLDNCASARKIPILEIHGTADAVVPYGGTPLFTLGTEAGIDWWLEHNNCTNSALITEIEDIDMADGSTATSYKYQNCATNTQVWLFKVENGSHTWPGAFALPGAGSTNQDFSASEVIWEFFSQFTHPNPAVVLSTEAIQNDAISVYPNPFSEELFVEGLPSTSKRICLFDMNGQLIFEQKNNTQTTTSIQVPSHLPAGVYQLTIGTDKGIQAMRVVRLKQ